MTPPALIDFDQAIQDPANVFKDRDLANARVERDRYGFPKSRSGAFTVTYRLIDGDRSWAVRCLLRPTEALHRRYAVLGEALARGRPPFLVGFAYLENEMLVNGRRWPVVKMPWVEGSTLDTWLDAHRDDGASVRAVADSLRGAVTILESLGIAHGDLQHGNIIVQGADVVLVDYDGMHVPALQGIPPAEAGHRNYQSPQRRTIVDDGAVLDRFPAHSILLSLDALAEAPHLWNLYYNDDNLLFTDQDFAKPGDSPALANIETIPSLADRVQAFRTWCTLPLAEVPSLDSIVKIGPLEPILDPPAGHPWPLLSLNDGDMPKSFLYRTFEIIGKVRSARPVSGTEPNGYRLWFRDDPRSVSVWLPRSVAQSLANRGISADSLVGLWIWMPGRVHPTMQLGTYAIPLINPGDLLVLGGQDEALRIRDASARFEFDPAYGPHLRREQLERRRLSASR